MDLENEELKQKIKILEEENARLRGELEVPKVDESIASTPTHQMVAPAAQMMDRVGVMEHSGVNPSAAGGCKVEDPLGPLTRSQVDVTELCQRIPFGNSRLAPSVPDSVKSTCDDKTEYKIVRFTFIQYISLVKK